MIRIEVRKNPLIRRIQISGHALGGPYGEDLICAAVSAIGTGMLNALDQLAPDAVQLKLEDTPLIDALFVSDDSIAQTVAQTALIQLETIRQQYPEHLIINMEEKS